MPAQTLSPFVDASLDAAHLDDPGTATGRTLGWGVVSTADIAEKVVPDIAALPDARLVAVSSRDQDRAEDFARRHGVKRAYGGTATSTGLDRLAADPDVEIVYVATPHGYHHRDVSALLRAGKHVVCEKALAMTAMEVRDLFRLAREHGVFLMEAVWTRMTPGFRTAMRWVREGRLGRVRSVEGSIGTHRALDPAHRLFRRADGGGVLLDMMVYPLTWTAAVLGAPERWSARAELGATDVDLDTALTRVTSTLGDVGALYNRLDRARLAAEDLTLGLTSSLATVENVDLARATMDLKLNEVAYQAGLAATARLVQPSLSDFLR